jgi:KTSC domain
MRRIPVRSTSIASIGYLPAKRELEIRFRASGDVYRYFDVPDEEYAAFMAAESKGTYLNQVFKPRGYRHAVVSEGKNSQVCIAKYRCFIGLW